MTIKSSLLKNLCLLQLKMNDIERSERTDNPKCRANIFSRISFFYTLPLFRKGCSKKLDEEDLYKVLPQYKSKLLGDFLEDQWENQKSSRKHQSVTLLLWKCYGWNYLLLGITQLIYKSIIIIVQPTALGNLVSYFEPGQKQLSKIDAYFWATVLITVNFLSRVYIHNYYLFVVSLGIRIRTAFCSFIYRKTLKLNSITINELTIGKILTLITKDVHSFEKFLQYANEVWIGIFQTIAATYLIYRKIGPPAFMGIGCFIIVIPMQLFLGKLATKLRKNMCRQTDERLQSTQETLSWIKQIKMYVWESFFNEKITDLRKKEVKSLHRFFYLKFIGLQIGTLNSSIAFFLLIMSVSWSGQQIPAETVYFIITCFNILSHTMSVIVPNGISYAAEFVASCKRIGNVLKTIENKTENYKITYEFPEIIIENVTIALAGKEIFKNLDLRLSRGLTLLTGPVGSGKTSLLKTILGEYPIANGKMHVHGNISYAPQEHWLFPSSVKQNILFGEEYVETRYKQVLEVCGLKYDLETLPEGDATIVEDRALNFSKGQQARINLARAVYKKADIYLLDDSLSSLDSHVSSKVLQKCMVQFLDDKLVILVAQKQEEMDYFDNVVVLDNGKLELSCKSQKDVNFNRENIILRDNFDEESQLFHEKTEEFEETKKSEETNSEVYKNYINFGGGKTWFLLVFTIFALAQCAVSYTDLLVSKWVNLEQNNTTNQKVLEKNNILNWYSVMNVLRIFLTLARAFVLLAVAKKASLNMHRKMLSCTINAKLTFFDDTFIGNVLNYFSKDLATVDENIPNDIHNALSIFFTTIGVITLIVIVNQWLILPTIVLFLIMVSLRKFYLKTAQNLKRLELSTKAPVLCYLNASLEGLSTIKAFKAEKILKDEFDRHQDLYTSANFSFQCGMRAFAFWLDMCSTSLISAVVIILLLLKNETLPGNIGLVLTQVLQLTGSLQNGIRQWAEMENSLVSVERIISYIKCDQENETGIALDEWPKSGEINYENVTLRHRKKEILKNITFDVKSKEKIGIVGRTGAGKSSVISSLFRLYETDGKIIIDGMETKQLPLKLLRSKISVIPQDPMVFSGSIRSNIDPMRKFVDEDIWKAIETSNLKKAVPSLDIEIDKCNLSLGQKQLLCLARALIENNKIVVLDEATSNIDSGTDAVIQRVISEKFAQCTVLTIAHKLETIVNSNRILVLDNGEIMEYEKPDILLQNPETRFRKMAQDSKLALLGTKM